MTVQVTFKYDPDEPDDGHPVGMSNDEYEHLTGRVMELGAYDIEVEVVAPTASTPLPRKARPKP